MCPEARLGPSLGSNTATATDKDYAGYVNLLELTDAVFKTLM